MEFDTVYFFLGLLAFGLCAIVYLLVKERMIDRQIKAKEKFLENNPAPKKMIRFVLHDN